MTLEAEKMTYPEATRKLPTSPAGVQGGVVEMLLLEDSAWELSAHLEQIESSEEWSAWRAAHVKTVAAVLALLSDRAPKRNLARLLNKKSRRFNRKPFQLSLA